MTKILAIYRATRFSPNSVEKDKAILDEVSDLLKLKGYTVNFITEEKLTGNEDADFIFSMGRLQQTLDILKKKEALGITVLNSTQSVASCARSYIDKIMRDNNIPAAPLTGDCGYWLKRGDQAAQERNDVIFAANETDRDLKLGEFKQRGISNVVITAHVKGDCVKFYGVRGTGFFKTFYPCDDGETKFGNELHNGMPHHYEFSIADLNRDAEKLASLTGLYIYGGDCIVRQDGSYAIIDFNDWPSFSRCRHSAALTIASLIKEKESNGM